MYIQLFFLNFGKKNNTNPFRIRFRKVSICGMITRKTLKLKPRMWQVESHPSIPSSSPCCHVKWRLVVYFWRPKSKLLYFFVLFIIYLFLRPKNRRLYKFFFWDWKLEAFFLFFFPQRWKSRGQSLVFFLDTSVEGWCWYFHLKGEKWGWLLFFWRLSITLTEMIQIQCENCVFITEPQNSLS